MSSKSRTRALLVWALWAVPPVVLYTVVGVLAVVVVFAGVLYACQSWFIYVPQLPPGSREHVWTPERFGWGAGRDTFGEDAGAVQDGTVRWEQVWLQPRRGVKLQAYWIRARAADPGQGAPPVPAHGIPTVLFLQANAGNIVSTGGGGEGVDASV